MKTYYIILRQENNRYLKPRNNSKGKKRNRIISQQAIQLIGEKISSEMDSNNIKHQNKHSANFDNFLSLGSHYGNNRPNNQAFEINTKNLNDNASGKGSKIDHIKAEINKDINEGQNYVIISNNYNLRGRNGLSEDK